MDTRKDFLTEPSADNQEDALIFRRLTDVLLALLYLSECDQLMDDQSKFPLSIEIIFGIVHDESNQTKQIDSGLLSGTAERVDINTVLYFFQIRLK